MTVMQGWAFVALALTGPPSLAWALSKCVWWTGQ